MPLHDLSAHEVVLTDKLPAGGPDGVGVGVGDGGGGGGGDGVGGGVGVTSGGGGVGVGDGGGATVIVTSFAHGTKAPDVSCTSACRLKEPAFANAWLKLTFVTPSGVRVMSSPERNADNP